VPARSLQTYYGTDTATSVGSLPPVTTSSGDTITGDLENFTLAGQGLTGSGTYSTTLGPGKSGQAILGTTYPDGFTTFTGYLACNCSFGGQSGAVAIRAYGTTSPHGDTWGTFLIMSGGGPAAGSLTSLAGWGTFSQHGSGPVHLVEHLRIT